MENVSSGKEKGQNHALIIAKDDGIKTLSIQNHRIKKTFTVI